MWRKSQPDLKIISDLHSLSRIAFCRKTKHKKNTHNNFKRTRNLYFLKDTTLEALNKTKKKFIHFARQFHQQFIDYGHGLFTTWRSDWFTLNLFFRLCVWFIKAQDLQSLVFFFFFLAQAWILFVFKNKLNLRKVLIILRRRREVC